MYFPLAQHAAGLVFVAVRSEDDPMLLRASVRETVHGLDPSLPVERMRPMEEVFSESLQIPRMLTSVMAGFGVFGLLLVAIGLYGVVAYAAAARTHEIAVRVAIGATARDVLVLVLRRAMWLAVAGILCGVAGAWALARTMSSLLVGVGPHDPGIFAATALTVLGVALAAAYTPARIATKLDPVTALNDGGQTRF
jgi:ABC-type antimicrobial peptide transport system permease subunit